MASEKASDLGIVGQAAKHVGTCVGTTTAVSKKIGGASVEGLTTMGGWLRQPFRSSVPESGRAAALREREVAVSRTEQEIAAVRDKLEKVEDQIADALESGAEKGKVASLGREPDEACGQAAEAKSELSSQLSALHSEKESLLSDLRTAQAEAEDARSRAKDLNAEMSKLRESMKSAASEKEQLEPALAQERSAGAADAAKRKRAPEQAGASPKKAPAQPGAEPRVASEAADDAIPPEVTPEEAAAAVFPGVTEKVMFARAVRDSPSPNEATRTRAARIFSSIPHRLSARALAARLGRDPSADVRKECVNGLTALGIKEQLPAVERALGDASGPVRLAAVRGVYRLGGAAGAVSLVRMFSDELEDVRRRAVACLGWSGQEDLAREVVPLLRGKSASVRLAALEALGNLKSPAVVDEVIGLLDDPEEPVQRKAYQALRTITGKQMGRAFPEDEDGRKFLMARWRAWREENPSGPAG